MTAAEIIANLGGVSAVARQLGIPKTTIYSWRERDLIPEWRQPALLRLALEKSVTLSTADFPERQVA
jgi:transposase-like protein